MTILKKLFWLAVLIAPVSLFAAEEKVTEQATLKLITAKFDQDKYSSALHFKLKDDWHVYWRTPGDVGLPVTFDWAGSENLKEVQVLWPVPEKFVDAGDIESNAYKQEIAIPLNVIPLDASQPVNLKLKTTYGICSHICIFADAELSSELTPETANDEAAAIIEKFMKRVPAKANADTINILGARLKNSGKSTTAEINIISVNELAENLSVFVEGPENFRFPKPEVQVADDKKSAFVKQDIQPLISDKKFTAGELIVTVADEQVAVEKNLTLSFAGQVNSVLGIEIDNTFIYIALIAFIGGLILNVMPCVLPVLSIKMLGFVSHSGAKIKAVRIGFISSAAGIISSFMLLAAVVILFKQAGMAVGWGFNFQQPAFIITLAVILVFFAANLFGWFEVILPWWLSDILYKKTRSHETTTTGHFLSGFLATILATPCTAPYVGTAVSFALSAGIKEILWTFLFMGIGLAFPYIFFAVFPHLVKRLLPRSGNWMVKVKYAMGGLLLISIVWLLYVLLAQTGLISTLVIGAGVFGLLGLFYLFSQRKMRDLWQIAIFLPVIILIFVVPLSGVFAPKVQTNKGMESWQSFDQVKIRKYVESGKVVFLDITADWCLTCKANYLFVLSDKEVQSKLFGPGVIAMQGNWTNKNEQIREFLKANGRYGIPFNVVYGPGAPDGIILSELLSKGAVLEALEKAQKPKENQTLSD